MKKIVFGTQRVKILDSGLVLVLSVCFIGVREWDCPMWKTWS